MIEVFLFFLVFVTTTTNFRVQGDNDGVTAIIRNPTNQHVFCHALRGLNYTTTSNDGLSTAECFNSSVSRIDVVFDDGVPFAMNETGCVDYPTPPACARMVNVVNVMCMNPLGTIVCLPKSPCVKNILSYHQYLTVSNCTIFGPFFFHSAALSPVQVLFQDVTFVGLNRENVMETNPFIGITDVADSIPFTPNVTYVTIVRCLFQNVTIRSPFGAMSFGVDQVGVRDPPSCYLPNGTINVRMDDVVIERVVTSLHHPLELSCGVVANIGNLTIRHIGFYQTVKGMVNGTSGGGGLSASFQVIATISRLTLFNVSKSGGGFGGGLSITNYARVRIDEYIAS
eukprot:PhF_6_TR42651/c1_g1_i1/m.64209